MGSVLVQVDCRDGRSAGMAKPFSPAGQLQGFCLPCRPGLPSPAPGTYANVSYVPPLEPGAAEAMVASLRAAPLLDGYRGAPKADRQALVAVLEQVARVAEEVPEQIGRAHV